MSNLGVPTTEPNFILVGYSSPLDSMESDMEIDPPLVLEPNSTPGSPQPTSSPSEISEATSIWPYNLPAFPQQSPYAFDPCSPSKANDPLPKRRRVMEEGGLVARNIFPAIEYHPQSPVASSSRIPQAQPSLHLVPYDNKRAEQEKMRQYVRNVQLLWNSRFPGQGMFDGEFGSFPSQNQLIGELNRQLASSSSNNALEAHDDEWKIRSQKVGDGMKAEITCCCGKAYVIHFTGNDCSFQMKK